MAVIKMRNEECIPGLMPIEIECERDEWVEKLSEQQLCMRIMLLLLLLCIIRCMSWSALHTHIQISW